MYLCWSQSLSTKNVSNHMCTMKLPVKFTFLQLIDISDNGFPISHKLACQQLLACWPFHNFRAINNILMCLMYVFLLFLAIDYIDKWLQPCIVHMRGLPKGKSLELFCVVIWVLTIVIIVGINIYVYFRWKDMLFEWWLLVKIMSRSNCKPAYERYGRRTNFAHINRVGA